MKTTAKKEDWNLSSKIYDLFAKGEFPYIKLDAKQRQEIMYKVFKLNKEAVRLLKEELKSIETDFSVVGKLDNYQKRMLVQVFIDINNQIDKLLGDELNGK